MTDIKQKKENVKMHLKDLRQNLKKMHLSVTEELILSSELIIGESFFNEGLQELKKITIKNICDNFFIIFIFLSFDDS